MVGDPITTGRDDGPSTRPQDRHRPRRGKDTDTGGREGAQMESAAATDAGRQEVGRAYSSSGRSTQSAQQIRSEKKRHQAPAHVKADEDVSSG